jgi:2-aminoethylphosphonate-pyruvate transaminase
MTTRPLLLTPGPLTTAEAVRTAAILDHGSRDPAFVALSDAVRARLAALAGPSEALVAVPLQGSGTFAVEATLGTLVPRRGKALVLVNGAYGRRMVQLLQTMGREVAWIETPEDVPVDVEELERALSADPDVTHVAVVHCETTTGLLNPVDTVAAIVARHGRALIVDAMSAFGALSLRLEDVPFDAVVASSNKCLEGLPGLGFAIVRKEALARCEGNAHSVTLDLFDQQRRFAKDGQWRFTPPTHVLAAFAAALDLHEAEGGVGGRGARYRESCAVLVRGMRDLGFRTLLPDHLQAPIIVTFLEPASPAYAFDAFYEGLREEGFAIYPGKLTEQDTFRVGCIGQVFPDDLRRFLDAVHRVMGRLGIESGAPASGGY